MLTFSRNLRQPKDCQRRRLVLHKQKSTEKPTHSQNKSRISNFSLCICVCDLDLSFKFVRDRVIKFPRWRDATTPGRRSSAPRAACTRSSTPWRRLAMPAPASGSSPTTGFSWRRRGGTRTSFSVRRKDHCLAKNQAIIGFLEFQTKCSIRKRFTS